MPRIDILNAFSKEPAPQDFILPGFLAGTVGAMVSPGGAGKSFLALQIAAAVASDIPQANTTGMPINNHGSVLYINLEDPASEIERRLYALASRFDLVTRQGVALNLHISVRLGMPSDVLDKTFHAALMKAATGKRLVIIDTLSRSHGGDENDNGAMSQLIAHLEGVVRKTGAALLFLHHTSKAAALNGQGAAQQAARGASALIDNARFSCSLTKMTVDDSTKWAEVSGAQIGDNRHGLYARYETGKQNYGPVTTGRWYKRADGGILQPVELIPLDNRRKERGRGAI
jgi:RecA-family ATPase